MQNFVDIHCHILPGVDDGPQSLNDSMALALALHKQGFSSVVATPHYINDFSDSYRSHIKQKFNTLQNALIEKEIPLTLYLGGEVMLTPAVLEQIENKSLPVIHNTNYVLLELPFHQPIASYTTHILFTLRANGYQPIIAHPERTDVIKDDINILSELTHSGALLQVNLGSLNGIYGRRAKRTAETILNSGMAHVLATDSHDAALLMLLNKTCTYRTDLLMKKNPADILAGYPVSAAPPKQISYQERVKKFLRANR